MAFAIFYNDQDMPLLEAVSDQLGPYWEAGLSDWRNCPVSQSPFEQEIAANTARRIVVSYPDLEGLRHLLYLVGDGHLSAIADDMAGNCGAVEPWPVV